MLSIGRDGEKVEEKDATPHKRLDFLSISAMFANYGQEAFSHLLKN
jgi:hypothetical protein